MSDLSNRAPRGFSRRLRVATLSAAAGLLLAGTAAIAQVGVSVNIGAPPPPRYEVVPTVTAGYVWAPGYWNLEHGTWVWRRGHLVEARPGYRWAPDRWEGGRYYEGHLERDPNWHR